MRILQCGYGHIGKVLYKEFLTMANAMSGGLFVYDPYINECPNRVLDLTEHYDIAFVCVPTDQTKNGAADISKVLDCCLNIDADVIVIKSTIPLDIVDKLPANVIFSPEFTGTTPHCGEHHYVVLGGKRKLCNKVAALYQKIYDASFLIVCTDIKTAVMSKYMENCYLALKVTFCNEIAQVCRLNGIEYDDVRNIFVKDSRINPSHTFVYEDQPYYDLHCLNKDVSAFNAQFGMPLMRAVEYINNEMKSKFKIEK